MSYSPSFDVPISVFNDELQITFAPTGGGPNVTASFGSSPGKNYYVYTLPAASKVFSIQYSPDIYSGYLRGFRFNFNFRVSVNTSVEFDISTGGSYLNVYFTDGTYYTLDFSRTLANSIYFRGTLSFSEVKQIDSFELKVGFADFKVPDKYTIRLYPALSVSQIYSANDDIIDFGADDEEIAGLQDEALGNKEEVSGLLGKDSTPEFTYSAVDIESTDYANSTSFFSSLFENNVIALILPAVIGLVVIKYVLFGRG